MRSCRAAAGVRLVAGGTVGWLVVAVFSGAWRQAEAIVVRWVLLAAGFGDVDRFGHELLATSTDGQRFSAAISPWCSTLALVTLFGVVAVVAPPGRRLRAFGWASAIVVVGNIGRIVATVAIGVNRGPGAIESFHDGPATWFAVACLLAAMVVFGTVLTRAQVTGATVQPPKSPQMEATTPGRL